MAKTFLIGLFVAVVTIFALAQTADAGPISRNNPYRSFNISGINYGSMQWEKAHKKSSSSKSWSMGRRSGWFRRR